MSRQSTDHYNPETGRLIQGFDYVNQAWVDKGIYLTCGHPEGMACDCYGRQHAGEETKPGRLDGSEPPEPTHVTLCRELLPAYDRFVREGHEPAAPQDGSEPTEWPCGCDHGPYDPGTKCTKCHADLKSNQAVRVWGKKAGQYHIECAPSLEERGTPSAYLPFDVEEGIDIDWPPTGPRS